MKPLLKRDFFITLPYFYMVIVFVPITYLLRTSPLFMYYGLMIGLVVGLYYYDKQSEINRYLVSLPVSRNLIIVSRYVFCILVAVIAYVYFFIIDLLFHTYFYIKFPPVMADFGPMNSESILFYLFGAIIVMVIFIPLYVKFSFILATVINFTLLIAGPILFFNLVVLLEKWNIDWIFIFAFKMLELFFQQPFIFTIIATLLIGVISFLISKRIFLRRDFS